MKILHTVKAYTKKHTTKVAVGLFVGSIVLAGLIIGGSAVFASLTRTVEKAQTEDVATDVINDITTIQLNEPDLADEETTVVVEAETAVKIPIVKRNVIVQKQEVQPAELSEEQVSVDSEPEDDEAASQLSSRNTRRARAETISRRPHRSLAQLLLNVPMRMR